LRGCTVRPVEIVRSSTTGYGDINCSIIGPETGYIGSRTRDGKNSRLCNGEGSRINTTVVIGNGYSIGTGTKTGDIFSGGTVRPVEIVRSSTTGYGDINCSIVCSKTGYIGSNSCNGKNSRFCDCKGSRINTTVVVGNSYSIGSGT
jgi:hypothetical protein